MIDSAGSRVRQALLPDLLKCAALFVLAIPPLAQADEVDDLVEKHRIERKIPGLALLVVQNAQVVKAQGYGLANVELESPVKPETIFQSGSMGKQFTATAVMMLVEEGKLALDDSICKHLPKAPESWRPITIRHLLSHQAGLGDYPPLFDFRRDYNEDQLLAIVAKSPLKFQPGKDWIYSNPGYVLLGMIIRQASGKFYGDFLEERIFRPAGMKTARVIDEAEIIPHRAAGYRLEQGELKNQEWVSPTLNTTADGSLYLTVLDLARWDEALRENRFVKPASLEQMWTVAPLADGKPNRGNYGFGWMCATPNGHRLVQHGGAWQGFTTYIARYRDDGLTIAVLTNLSADSGPNPGKLAGKLAGQYVAELKTPPREVIDDPEPKTTQFVREQLERLARGEAKQDDFAGDAKEVIFPGQVSAVKAKFGPLGNVQQLELLERKVEDGERSLVYRLRFERGPTMELIVRLTGDQKIAQIRADAE